MQININNYEIFFLDYWENNLGKQDRDDMARFLERNPNLQDEFLEYKETNTFRLEPDNRIFFGSKNKLKHHEVVSVGKINDQNYETHIIAHFEGDHSLAQQNDFSDFIHKNPHLKPDLKLYSSTYLHADQRVVYKNKQQLKRSLILAFRSRAMLYGSIAAAIFLLAFLIFNPLQKIETLVKSELANNEEPFKIIDNTIASKNKNDGLSDRLHPKALLAEINNQPIPEPEKTKTSLIAREIIEISNDLEIQKPIRMHLPTNVDFLQSNLQPLLLGSDAFVISNIAQRTELSEAFNDIILRDALQIEKNNRNEKSAFARIIDNIGRQLFGITNTDSQNTLLAEVAQRGKERFSDFIENSPRIESTSDRGKKQTYFSINENFSIKISKDENNLQPNR